MSAAAVPPGAFEVTERARWEDADPVAIVRYSAYTRFLDVAEAELFRAAGLAHPALQERFGLVLVRRALTLEFRAPARFDALLRVSLWLGRAGASSLTFHAAVRDEPGRVTHAAGHVVVVAVDQHTLRKAPLPASVVSQLAAATAVAPA